MSFFKTKFIGFVLVFTTLTIFNIACTSDKIEYNKLKNYYNNNKEIHTTIFDQLTAFCKTNKTNIILRKSDVSDAKIVFRIHYANAFFPIEYDDGLNRHDPFPDLTAGLTIPIDLIKDFDKSIYSAVSSDSIETFFGSNWKVKAIIGTQSDSQYGVLVSSDTNAMTNCEFKISSHICLTTRGIH